jgi:hypothetical protein
VHVDVDGTMHLHLHAHNTNRVEPPMPSVYGTFPFGPSPITPPFPAHSWPFLNAHPPVLYEALEGFSGFEHDSLMLLLVLLLLLLLLLMLLLLLPMLLLLLFLLLLLLLRGALGFSSQRNAAILLAPSSFENGMCVGAWVCLGQVAVWVCVCVCVC